MGVVALYESAENFILQKGCLCLGLLFLVFVINIVSFAIGRRLCNLGMTLVSPKPAKGGRLNYFLAGNLNQPEAAYAFLLPEIDGEVIFARYRLLGWNARYSARKICQHIRLSKRRARVFTLSVSDSVGRELERMLGERVEIIAINPASDPSLIGRPFRIALRIVTPIMFVLCYLLGWLSVLPLIPTVGGRYSLILLTDQWLTLAYGCFPLPEGGTKVVVCSLEDEFLDNAEVLNFFVDPQTQIVAVDATHGNTVDEGEKYLEKLRPFVRDQRFSFPLR